MVHFLSALHVASVRSMLLHNTKGWGEVTEGKWKSWCWMRLPGWIQLYLNGDQTLCLTPVPGNPHHSQKCCCSLRNSFSVSPPNITVVLCILYLSGMFVWDYFLLSCPVSVNITFLMSTVLLWQSVWDVTLTVRADRSVPEPDAAGLTALLSAGLMRNHPELEQKSAAHSGSHPGATHTHTRTNYTIIDNNKMDTGPVARNVLLLLLMLWTDALTCW